MHGARKAQILLGKNKITDYIANSSNLKQK